MEWDTEWDTSGTHGVRYKIGTHTELDTNGVGFTRNGIYTEWDTRSGIHMEWNTHGVGYTWSGIHTEWDTQGVA